MELEQRTKIIVQISAAAAANALPTLRLAVTEGLNTGISKEEIQSIIKEALAIQKQPFSYTENMVNQLFREPKKTNHVHVHSADCGCQC